MDKALALIKDIQGLPLALQVASVAGLFYLSTKVLWILRLLWTYYLRPGANLSKYKGTWAVVTGSSYGIGAGFAKRIASHGINVVLMARSKDKLDELARELESTYKVKTLVIPFDFATKDYTQYDALKQQFDQLDITILVNNVGVLTNDIKFFLDYTPDEMDWVTHVNISSVNHMTRVLLPTLLQKKKGLVLNVASISGRQELNPIHFFAVYGSTKAYMIRLTQALDAEYGGKGVEFLAITPSFVTSKMSHFRKGNFLVLTEEELVHASMHKIGHNQVVIQPHFRHLLAHAIWHVFPWAITWVVNYFKGKLDARNAAEAKKKQKSQ